MADNKRCENCIYFARDYEDNDIWCNNRKSEHFRECVSHKDSCGKWKAKE